MCANNLNSLVDSTDLLDCHLVHNHLQDPQKLSREIVSNSCKRKAVDEVCERPSKIINKEVANSAFKGHLTTADLRLIRHNISRNRLKSLPKIPTNISEVHETLNLLNVETDRHENFLLCNDFESNIVIFGCKANLECLGGADTYYMDGTFKYCPKFFFQLFTLHSVRNGHYIPLLFCLLPNKLTNTYIQLFTHIVNVAREMNILLKPSTIVIDFEIGIHNAVKVVWPSTEIFGCRFHLSQSWFRKIQNLGLVKLYRNTTDEGKWLQHLFGLPFLAPDRVSECFVNDFMSDIPRSKSFAELADYLVLTYIAENSLFPPVMWSRNTSDIGLSTNPCESFHAHFSNCFYHTHPNINVFLQTLLEFQVNVYIRIQSVETKALTKTKRTKQAESFLKRHIEMLTNGEISEYNFVKAVSYRYKI